MRLRGVPHSWLSAAFSVFKNDISGTVPSELGQLRSLGKWQVAVAVAFLTSPKWFVLWCVCVTVTVRCGRDKDIFCCLDSLPPIKSLSHLVRIVLLFIFYSNLFPSPTLAFPLLSFLSLQGASTSTRRGWSLPSHQ